MRSGESPTPTDQKPSEATVVDQMMPICNLGSLGPSVVWTSAPWVLEASSKHAEKRNLVAWNHLGTIRPRIRDSAFLASSAPRAAYVFTDRSRFCRFSCQWMAQKTGDGQKMRCLKKSEMLKRFNVDS